MNKVKLGEVFKISSGGTPSKAHPEYYGGSIPWVKTGDLKTKYLYEVESYITEAGLNNSSAKIYDPETVLIAMYGATIGATSILKIKACTNQACAAFKANDNILPEFLYYFLLSQKNRFIKDGVGGAQPNISANYLKRILFPVMSLNQQRVIVDRMNRIDEMLLSLSVFGDKLDELIKSRFVEMFGDLADPKCNWEKFSLTNLCNKKGDIKCGPFGTQLSKDEYTDSGIALWEIPQINSAFSLPPTHFIKKEKAKKLQDYSLIAGDIAMSRKGNVGRCAIFPDGYEDGIIHSDVLRIRLNKEKVNPVFIMCQLHFSGYVTKQIELVSHGAIMAGINVTKLKDILLHVPPITLQNQFADFVSQVEKQKATVQHSIDKLETLKKALMQEYFG